MVTNYVPFWFWIGSPCLGPHLPLLIVSYITLFNALTPMEWRSSSLHCISLSTRSIPTLVPAHLKELDLDSNSMQKNHDFPQSIYINGLLDGLLTSLGTIC